MVRGDVTLDDSPVSTGATVQAGQTISTTKGEAIIDLGTRGRIVLGPNSKIQLLMTDDSVRVICIKDPCRVHVLAGNVQIEGNYKLVLKEDERTLLHSGDEAIMLTSSNLTINYQAKTSMKGPGKIGVISVMGIGAAVAAGVAVGNGDTGSIARPPVSGS